MHLSHCPLRKKARVISVGVEKQFELRLQELGVRVGAEFVVINRAAFGGVVMNIGGTRVAIDRRCAQNMEVEEIEASK